MRGSRDRSRDRRNVCSPGTRHLARHPIAPKPGSDVAMVNDLVAPEAVNGLLAAQGRVWNGRNSQRWKATLTQWGGLSLRRIRRAVFPSSTFRLQAIFDFQSPSVAPVGSVIILSQPAPGASVTSFTILAPSDFAFLVVASMSFTST